jgi:hypothetical protein
MTTIVNDLNEAIATLEKSSNFGRDFCRLKQDFFRKHQRGFVFSTRFGASFFESVRHYVITGEQLAPPPGEKQGDFDRNFNIWLKQVRK